MKVSVEAGPVSLVMHCAVIKVLRRVVMCDEGRNKAQLGRETRGRPRMVECKEETEGGGREEERAGGGGREGRRSRDEALDSAQRRADAMSGTACGWPTTESSVCVSQPSTPSGEDEGAEEGEGRGTHARGDRRRSARTQRRDREGTPSSPSSKVGR